MKPTVTRELASRLWPWLRAQTIGRAALTRQVGDEQAAILARLESNLNAARPVVARWLLGSIRAKQERGLEKVVRARDLAAGLDVMPQAARALAKPMAEALLGAENPRTHLLAEALEKAWAEMPPPRVRATIATGEKREETEMATTGNCVGGWQTGEASFREIAPLVIERIPGLEHGPPSAPGVVAKIAGLADSNRPTVYGVIRDLREGRSLDDPLRPQGAPPAAASNGKHEPPATPEAFVREDEEGRALAAEDPPKRVAPVVNEWPAKEHILSGLLPASFSGADVVGSLAKYIGSLKRDVATLREQAARVPGEAPAALAHLNSGCAESLAVGALAVGALAADFLADVTCLDCLRQEAFRLRLAQSESGDCLRAALSPAKREEPCVVTAAVELILEYRRAIAELQERSDAATDQSAEIARLERLERDYAIQSRSVTRLSLEASDNRAQLATTEAANKLLTAAIGETSEAAPAVHLDNGALGAWCGTKADAEAIDELDASCLACLHALSQARFSRGERQAEKLQALTGEVTSRDTQIEQLRAEVATKHAVEVIAGAFAEGPKPAPPAFHLIAPHLTSGYRCGADVFDEDGCSDPFRATCSGCLQLTIQDLRAERDNQSATLLAMAGEREARQNRATPHQATEIARLETELEAARAVLATNRQESLDSSSALPAAERPPGLHQRPASAPEAAAGPSVALRPVALEHAPSNGNGYRRPPLSSAERWDALRLAAGVGELADVRDLPTWAQQLEMASFIASLATGQAA